MNGVTIFSKDFVSNFWFLGNDRPPKCGLLQYFGFIDVNRAVRFPGY